MTRECLEWRVGLVPDFAYALLDVRIVPGQTPESVQADLERVIARLARRVPRLRATVSIMDRTRHLFMPPFYVPPKAEVVQATAAAHRQVVGREPEWGGVTKYAGSDAAHLWNAGIPGLLYQGPGTGHWLGTDEVGRDILSRLLHGARLSLLTGVVAVGIALALGLPIGVLAGFGGRGADLALMGLMDVLLAFPTLLLAILIVTILGPGAESAMLAVGLSSVPLFARLVRASALVIRETDYVAAARAVGGRTPRVVLVHVLPNALSPIVVQSTLRIATAILTAAGLGFLGWAPSPRPPSGA
jgi:ABC-type dipeptide/oligopeptide/nickel transport system permease subunit